MIRFLIPLALFALWVWALVDAISVPDDSMYRAGNKLVWVIVIVFTFAIGAALYLVVGRPIRESHQRPRRPPPDDII